jgi:hypothetical protein
MTQVKTAKGNMMFELIETEERESLCQCIAHDLRERAKKTTDKKARRKFNAVAAILDKSANALWEERAALNIVLIFDSNFNTDAFQRRLEKFLAGLGTNRTEYRCADDFAWTLADLTGKASKAA